MQNCTLQILFQDTVADPQNKIAMAIAANNLARQIIALSDKIKADHESVYQFMVVTSPCTILTKKPEQTPIATVTLPTPVLPSAPVIAAKPELTTLEQMLDHIFKDIKKTDKSRRIVSAFIANSGSDIKVDRLMELTSMNKNDISSWLAQTGKRISAITNPSRGIYKFDPDKL